MDSRLKPYLEQSFRVVQMFTDPKAYARDTINQGISEIRENIKFYILNDLNKESEVRQDMAQNVFTNEERLKWFGKQQLGMRDFTWDACEALLRPANVRGAVFRVDGALAGSRNNEMFSSDRDGMSADGLSRREAIYTPRTVTVYDSKEQALAAAKLLRIITRGSGATILAEEITRGTKDKVWVVSDNMDLKTHNTVRMFMFALSRSQSNEARADNQVVAQEEVNKRLPEGQSWEAWEGAGTLLTLQGRPGVKMYKKLANGEDDERDVALLKRLPAQRTPRFLRGVPHSMIATDGRSLVDPTNGIDVVGHIIMGPKGNALIRGNWRVAGEIITQEAREEYGAVLEQKSIAGKTGRATEMFLGVGGHLIEKPLKAVAALSAGVLSATVMAAGTGTHKVARVGYGIYRAVHNGADYREPDTLVSSLGKRWVEKKVGSRANRPRLYKVWEERDGADEPALQVQGHQLEAIQPSNGELNGPLGVIHMIEQGKADWVARVEVGQEARDFASFMKQENRWPTLDAVCAQRYRSPVNDYPEGLKTAFDQLAEAYAKWVLMQQRKHHLAEAVSTGEESQEFAAAINRFNQAVERIPSLPADTANIIKDSVVGAVTEGMEAFILRETARQNAASVA